MAESDGTLTPLGNLAWHGCGSCGLLIPAAWEYCRHCGEELWAIARQGPRPLAWWYLGKASGSWADSGGSPAGAVAQSRLLYVEGDDCVCESEFIAACGPECECYHHRPVALCAAPESELELRAAWGDR